MYGKTHTPETRKFLSENSSGRPSPIKGMHFDDFMEPAACAARKEELSKQAKLRTGDKNSFYGKTHSEEAKRLMSENGKGSIPPNRVPVVIDNVRYETVHHAGIALDINPATVRWRIYSKNKKFANYCLHEE